VDGEPVIIRLQPDTEGWTPKGIVRLDVTEPPHHAHSGTTGTVPWRPNGLTERLTLGRLAPRPSQGMPCPTRCGLSDVRP